MIGYSVNKARTLVWTMFYRSVGRFCFSHLGKGVTFQGWVEIPQRGGRVIIGDYVTICRRVEFSVPNGGELFLGDNVFIGPGVIISAHKMVEIGADSLIGEYVSIHDNNHITARLDLPIAGQGFTTEAIHLGKNCWVGAHSVLVQGSGLSDGCILGAGAVLVGKIPTSATVVGVPAKAVHFKSLVGADGKS
jgi:acetyltransferase-like isoleucine patch superfamily enzyme